MSDTQITSVPVSGGRRPATDALPPAAAAAAAGTDAEDAANGPGRSPAEIEADIERTRARLAATVDAIATRVSPANVARRGAESARLQVVDERGNVRVQRVAIAAGVLLGLVALAVWRRRR